MTTSPQDSRTHIIDLSVQILDPIRFRCSIELAPFQNPPDLLIELFDLEENRLLQLSVIETPDTMNSFVLHLRHPPTTPEVKIVVYVKYEGIGIIDTAETFFTLDR